MENFSCVIPCFPPHLKHLNNCFEQIKKQSLLPKEVILAVSETTNQDAKNIYDKYNIFFF